MMPTRVVRAALIALCAAAFPLLSACSSDDDIDLATYVEQTEPADVLYNQGLANSNSRPPQGGGQEVRGGRPPASLFGVGAQVDGDGRLRATTARAITTTRSTSAKRYVTLYPTNPDAAYAQYIIGLSYFRQIRDVTQDQKRSAPDHRGDGRAGPALARIRICRGRQGQDPLRPRPARRQGDADRPLLSGAPRIHRRDQALPQRRRELLQHPPGRGGAGAPDRGLLRDGPDRRKRRRPRPCSATTIPTASGTRIPTRCCRAAGWSRARMPARGCPRPARCSASTG